MREYFFNAEDAEDTEELKLRVLCVLRVISLFFLLSLFACGYTFQGAGSVLPPDVKNIYIPIVENQTVESGLTIIVTEALRDRFERYGVLTVVDSLSEADAILDAKIIALKRQTKNVSSSDTALEYDLVLYLSGELKRVDGSPLWRGSSVKATKSVGSTSDVVIASSSDFFGGSIDSGDLAQLESLDVFRGQEQEALLDLSDDIARKVYENAVLPEF